jgi:hypothetical protein
VFSDDNISLQPGQTECNDLQIDIESDVEDHEGENLHVSPFHTPNIPTLPLKWRRALKSVKMITINLLQEPTDHKSSILNKYQM